MSKPSTNAPQPAPYAPPAAPSLFAGSWEKDREKHLEALRRLDDVHRKLINLRNAIPAILRPLQQSLDRAEIYSQFASRAQAGVAEIAAFTSAYLDCGPIFDHALVSRQQNQNVPALGVHEIFLKDGEESQLHPELVPLRQDDAEKQLHVDAAADTPESGIDELLEKFRGAHPEAAATEERKTGRRVLKITLPAPARLMFAVEVHAGVGVDPARRFIVASVQDAKHPERPPSHLLVSVLHAITTRSEPGNLGRLLDMIWSYRGIFTEKCVKCGRLALGAELPCLRRWQKTDSAGTSDGTEERDWKAFHEACWRG